MIPQAAIDGALDLLPRRMGTQRARVMLVAIGLQESNFAHRVQVLDGGGRGPARGFWQFEKAGGVRGVLEHAASAHWARAVCVERKVMTDRHSVWEQLEHDDVLAAAFARLLLWTDPDALPEDERGGWHYYLRNWRPGKPHADRWPACWSQAMRMVYGWD